MSEGPPHVEFVCERLMRDLAIRKAMFDGAHSVEVPPDGVAFWTWYKALVNPAARIDIVPCSDFPAYPPVNRGLALWYSGGCESTYSREALENEKLDLLRIEDFDLFRGEHRKIGQIHFLCAAIGASLGYGVTYLGVERNDLLFSRAGRGGRYVERSPDFLDAWTSYLGDRQLRSVCRHLAKEEILLDLARRGLGVTGTCDLYKDGRWCGRCFKCYEAFYAAKAVGVSLPIALSAAAFRRFHGEYEAFLASGYKKNFNNAQQFFLRLQVLYGLEFDYLTDCDLEGADGSVVAVL